MNSKRLPPSKKPFAKKSFGQNFLVDAGYIDKIIAALDPRDGETVIEIGAGRGALTEKLIDSGAEVVAIELEHEMISVLKNRFETCENFKLIESDALKISFSELIGADRKAKLVANLPYYISTAILQKIIGEREKFSEIVLMFQREVVERITAVPGNSERGFLTVLTENAFAAEKLFDVPPNAFRPAPKVWSAVVRLTAKESELRDEKLFREVISAAFFQKRKTLLNNLKNSKSEILKHFEWHSALTEAEIDPQRRAESLTLEEWKRLMNKLIKV